MFSDIIKSQICENEKAQIHKQKTFYMHVALIPNANLPHTFLCTCLWKYFRLNGIIIKTGVIHDQAVEYWEDNTIRNY